MNDDYPDNELPIGEAPHPESRASLDALVNAYADARRAREEADDRVKRLTDIEQRAETALFDEMERLNLRSVKHDRGLFMLNDLAWASVEDREAVLSWAQREFPELLTLNNQRLSVLVREYLKGERDEMPPGTGFKTSRKINWRRG